MLGPHATQKGSRVDPDGLRFDFSHFEPLTGEQIEEIETLVAEAVLANNSAVTEELSYEEARKRGWEADGIDLSNDLAAVASTRNPGSGVMAGDISEQGFEGAGYDAIIALDVLEHVVSPSKMMKVCHEALRPGGLMLLQTPNTHSFRFRSQRGKWDMLIPDQHLTPGQHKAFAAHFGELHIHPQLRGAKMEHPEVLPVVTNEHSPFTPGDGWHSDVTCDEIPPMGSMLYIRETPDCGGGDTLYADMYMAYDLLSEPMKRFLEGLTAIHDGAGPYSEQREIGLGKPDPAGDPRAEHPIVVRHPETGRKLLYVNSGFTTRIVGLSSAESRAVLDLLFRHTRAVEKIGADRSWAHSVHADLSLCEFGCQNASNGSQGSLGGVVEDATRQCDISGDGCIKHDGASAAQQGCDCLDVQDRTTHIHRILLVECFCRHLGGSSEMGITGIEKCVH